MAESLTGDPAEAEPSEGDAEKFDRELRYRTFTKRGPKWVVSAIAIAIAAYQLYTAAFPIVSAHPQRAIHLAGMLSLGFLLYPATKGGDRRRIPLQDWFLAAVAIAVNFYIVVGYGGIVQRGTSNYDTLDLVMGVVAVLLVLEGARRVMGLGLPILVLAFIAYGYLGRLVPVSLFAHRGYTLQDIAAYMYMGLDGVYGTALGVSATYLVLFIIFGAFMAKSGLGQFFNELAIALTGRYKGGPAKVAVVASALMGSINGSALANVVSTGSFTIPLMKKIGYKKNFAGAVEASASVGGQILPPIMGAAAFIMAQTLGISYSVIVVAAFPAAILYFLGVITQVHLRASRLELSGLHKTEVPNVSTVLRERGHLIIPIVVLIVLLVFVNVSITFAAFWSIVVTVATAMLRRSTRMRPTDILAALENGARQTVTVALACAAVGIIVGIAALTGFGNNFATAIVELGGSNLFLALVFTMLTAMLLGIGMPSIPAYLIAVTVAAPALKELGVEPLAAHMFVFYFGIFANLTPPVALAAFAASGVSGGSPMRTGVQALKLALAGFVVPYMFVYSSSLLMHRSHPLDALPLFGLGVVIVLLVATALEGYMLRPLGWVWRGVLLAGALLAIMPGWTTDVVGLAVGAAALLTQLVVVRREQAPAG